MELWIRGPECCYLQAIPHGMVNRRTSQLWSRLRSLGSSSLGVPRGGILERYSGTHWGGLHAEFELELELELEPVLWLGLERALELDLELQA